MSVGHGKDAKVFLNGRDMTAYIKMAEVNMTADVHETTTMGAGTVTRTGGLLDGKVSADGLYDGATNAIFDMVNTILAAAADALLVLWPLGDAAIGNIGFGLRCRETDYAVDIPVANILTASLNADADDDIDMLECLHPTAAETAAGNSTALDGGASSAAGGSAYIELSAFTGTSITVTVEHSVDNITFSTLGTFSVISAGPASERITFVGTVNRYVREKRAGTITSATYGVGFRRN